MPLMEIETSYWNKRVPYYGCRVGIGYVHVHKDRSCSRHGSFGRISTVIRE